MITDYIIIALCVITILISTVALIKVKKANTQNDTIDEIRNNLELQGTFAYNNKKQ